MKNTLLCLLLPVVLFAQTELSVSQALQIALKNNYDIRLSAQDLKSAQISNSWGAAGAFPSLTVQVADNYTITETDPQTTDRDRLAGTVTLAWRLFNGFSGYIAKNQLEEYENLSSGNLQILVENTIQSVLLAYYNVLYQQDKLKVLETVKKLSEDRYLAEEQRKEIGSLTTFDLLQAKNAWLEDKAAYLQQQATFRNSIHQLNYLLGEAEEQDYAFPQKFEVDTQTYELAKIREKMLANNSTLKNQYLYQQLLELDVQAAKFAVLPSLNLSASYEKQNTRTRVDEAAWQDSDSWGPAVNLSLSWGLFNGGAKKRAIQLAKISHESGEIELQALKHSLTNQLYNYFELHAVRVEVLNVEREAQKTAELNLQIAEEKFKNGSINSFNYRDVQLVYLNAALGRLKAIYDYIEIDTALLRISGGITESIE